MIDKTLDKVAAAIRRRDEMVDTLRPKIHEFLGELMHGMIQRGIARLALQIADEDGVRRYFVTITPLEKFDHLYQVKVSKNKAQTQPLLVAEIFDDAQPALRGITRPLHTDDVAELYTFGADFQNEESHARTEITADAVAILMKPRAH